MVLKALRTKWFSFLSGNGRAGENFGSVGRVIAIRLLVGKGVNLDRKLLLPEERRNGKN